jgi:hypothetical protein
MNIKARHAGEYAEDGISVLTRAPFGRRHVVSLPNFRRRRTSAATPSRGVTLRPSDSGSAHRTASSLGGVN